MVRVGRVAGVFGLRGAVKVESFTDFNDRFAPGSQLLIRGNRETIEWSRESPAGFVVKLAGIEDRSSAERLRGGYLEVPEAAVHQLPADTWYHHDLVGLPVSTESGRPLGVLSEVQMLPANDVWVVRDGRAEHLVPATSGAVLRVDLSGKGVTVADWLLETEDSC
ncbi:MAG: ribosome maturation factor RimM [Candidatus Dormibacteraeota bacterium]|uniref:ribosome maturation factor RimM n=1 Tax=Candidatus Dormibacter sp. TaxID=2973982 RepID=UPI000DB4B378|nr:ribosome maturation factor RimM [Candidatus Dormibacteraeota bacterium]PZR68891.1 MAG: 16S rRNA processing protein RimM [Candidatus Dormibacteraeota bacterium]